MDYSSRCKIKPQQTSLDGTILAKDLDESYTYTAKKGTWFLNGDKIALDTNMGEIGGFFSGIIKVGKIHGRYYIDKYGFAKEVVEKEICKWEDFDIRDSSGNLVSVVYEEEICNKIV